MCVKANRRGFDPQPSPARPFTKLLQLGYSLFSGSGFIWRYNAFRPQAQLEPIPGHRHEKMEKVPPFKPKYISKPFGWFCRLWPYGSWCGSSGIYTRSVTATKLPFFVRRNTTVPAIHTADRRVDSRSRTALRPAICYFEADAGAAAGASSSSPESSTRIADPGTISKLTASLPLG